MKEEKIINKSLISLQDANEFIQKKYKVEIFGLYDITKNKDIKTLTYFSNNLNKKIIINDNWIVFFIRKKNVENIDKIAAWLNHIEYSIGNKHEADLTKEVINNLNPDLYSELKKPGRIIRYIQEEVTKKKKFSVTNLKINKNRQIHIGLKFKQSGKAYFSQKYGIWDYVFQSSTISWFPKYEKQRIEKELQKLDFFKKVNSSFFEHAKKLYPMDAKLFNEYEKYSSFLNSKASAKIEGYDIGEIGSTIFLKENKKMQKNWHLNLTAVKNINNAINNFNFNQEFDNLLLHDIQSKVVNNTWENEKEKKQKTPGYFRDFQIYVVDRRKQYEIRSGQMTNFSFIAPKENHLEYYLDALFNFYNQQHKKVHPYLLATIIKALFVIIHPYGDGNGRTGRLLFLWSLLRDEWIENLTAFPIFSTILSKKKEYYSALETVTKPTLKMIDLHIDPLSRQYQISYDDINMFLNLDYTSYILYSIKIGQKALIESMFHYKQFYILQTIFKKIKVLTRIKDREQLLTIERVVKAQLVEQNWGKKTEKKLHFLTEKKRNKIKELLIHYYDKYNVIEIDEIDQELNDMLANFFDEKIIENKKSTL